jgi:hypothetical protein
METSLFDRIRSFSVCGLRDSSTRAINCRDCLTRLKAPSVVDAHTLSKRFNQLRDISRSFALCAVSDGLVAHD